MRDPQRIDKILGRIGLLWKNNPDMRLGQFLLAACKPENLYYIEDETLLNNLDCLFGPDGWIPMKGE